MGVGLRKNITFVSKILKTLIIELLINRKTIWDMNKNYLGSCIRVAVAAIAALCCHDAEAQMLRTTYFMDGSHYRMQLNPALAPTRGFIHLPGVGNTGAAYRSNSLNIDNLIDIMDNRDDATYFTSDNFFNGLDEKNHALLNASTDLLAVGWWHGKSFWSINWGVKADGYVSAPRTAFSFLRDMKGMNKIDYAHYVSDVMNEELNVNAYSEMGVGWARQFGNFSAGVRVKGLLGIGHVNLKVNRMLVQTSFEGIDPGMDWSNPDYDELMDVTGTATIDVDAELQSSCEGLLFPANEAGYIDDLDFDTGKMGIAGIGAGIDVGVACRVAGGLTLSAAVVDLGFIKWSKKATQLARSSASTMSFDTENPNDMVDFMDVICSGKVLNPDLLRLYPEGESSKARTTNLASTMTLGAEYATMSDQLRFGILYSNHFAHIRNESEVTLSVNYSPSSMVDFSASYSPLLCGGKSFGLAVKAGPLFVGTDYMYLGKDTKCCNALIGISIPLGAGNQESE